ncbi:MAG: carboxypeptidase regulatory-like domain-containing protein, partial [bacterium]
GDSIGNLNFKLQSNLAKVAGTVADSSGFPVSNAFVILTNANQTLSDTTGTNGFYFIDKVYPGTSEIQAFKEGFYGERKVLNLSGQEQINLDLTLYPANGFIRGTVRDFQDSTGLAEVIVSAEFSEEPGDFFTTTTDVSGNYTISNLPVVPNTKYTVFAFKEGFFSPSPMSNVSPNTNGVDFYLIGKNAIISGIVKDRDTAEPLENAKVEATNRLGSRSTAFTDSLGEFLLTGIVPTELYDISVTKNGFFTEVVQDVAPGDTAVVITLLRRYAFVMGQVVDFSTGEKLENVPIEAFPNGLEGRKGSAVTDVYGEYLLRLIAGNYTIQPVKTHHRSDPSSVQLTLSQEDTVSGVDFVLEPQTVHSISIQRVDQTEQPTISNLEVHCYAASARDDKNRPVNIGTPKWSLNVSRKAAVIDSSGCVTFDPGYLGELTITATDPVSGVRGTLDVEVFAPIDSTTQTVLFDDRGLQMEISRGTVRTRKELLVSKEPLAPAKKGRATFFTTDSSYITKPAGLTFNKQVKLRLLPPPNTTGQERFIAKWNAEKSEWDVLATVEKNNNLIEANIDETGEYVALAISKPLTIENLSLLPNPFSPFQEIKGGMGLKIEFDISSNAAPNPLLTIKIYNLEGNLVRLLHDQTPFPRGHSTIYWDGRTDTGALARNGRYLVRLIVEDPTESKEDMTSVVLIK